MKNIFIISSLFSSLFLVNINSGMTSSSSTAPSVLPAKDSTPFGKALSTMGNKSPFEAGVFNGIKDNPQIIEKAFSTAVNANYLQALPQSMKKFSGLTPIDRTLVGTAALKDQELLQLSLPANGPIEDINFKLRQDVFRRFLVIHMVSLDRYWKMINGRNQKIEEIKIRRTQLEEFERLENEYNKIAQQLICTKKEEIVGLKSSQGAFFDQLIKEFETLKKNANTFQNVFSLQMTGKIAPQQAGGYAPTLINAIKTGQVLSYGLGPAIAAATTAVETFPFASAMKNISAYLTMQAIGIGAATPFLFGPVGTLAIVASNTPGAEAFSRFTRQHITHRLPESVRGYFVYEAARLTMTQGGYDILHQWEEIFSYAEQCISLIIQKIHEKKRDVMSICDQQEKLLTRFNQLFDEIRKKVDIEEILSLIGINIITALEYSSILQNENSRFEDKERFIVEVLIKNNIQSEFERKRTEVANYTNKLFSSPRYAKVLLDRTKRLGTMATQLMAQYISNPLKVYAGKPVKNLLRTMSPKFLQEAARSLAKSFEKAQPLAEIIAPEKDKERLRRKAREEILGQETFRENETEKPSIQQYSLKSFVGNMVGRLRSLASGE